MTRSGEFEWIARYLAPLSGDGSFGLVDDAALLELPAGKRCVVTQDAIVERIHFLPGDPPELVARKALRVNVSDIVAKGALPFAYCLALGVPDRWHDGDMEAFAGGLRSDQDNFGLTLAGGDTCRSPDQLHVCVTMFGLVEPKRYVSRIGADPGDGIFVTGTIGDAAIGLRVAMREMLAPNDERTHFLDAYQLPKPYLAMSAIVAEFASASMDISDGLIGDCRKLCTASHVSAELQRDAIPLSAAVRRCVETDGGSWSHVLTGGDDYQVLCTVKPSRCEDFVGTAATAAIPVSRIGTIVEGKKGTVTLDIDGDQVSIDGDSYTHF